MKDEDESGKRKADGGGRKVEGSSVKWGENLQLLSAFFADGPDIRGYLTRLYIFPYHAECSAITEQGTPESVCYANLDSKFIDRVIVRLTNLCHPRKHERKS